MLDGLADDEQYWPDGQVLRQSLAVRLVRFFLLSKELTSILQLGALVLSAVLPVDNHRHLHMPVSDRLPERVLEHNLVQVCLIGSRRQPNKGEGSKISDCC